MEWRSMLHPSWPLAFKSGSHSGPFPTSSDWFDRREKVNHSHPTPHCFSYVWQGNDLQEDAFVCVAGKGVMGVLFACVAGKGVSASAGGLTIGGLKRAGARTPRICKKEAASL
jgi:hypothetical protein